MKQTILIVDDKKLNIDIITDILSDSYAVMAATSGERALKLLEKRKPDLVLLDVFMPGIDGFDVLRQMRMDAELSNIPVIFVTGEHDTSAEEKGLLLGAVDYVKKPFVPSIIRIKVRNHLELKSYRDSLESLVRTRTKQLEASREAIIMGMSLMSDIHDKATGEHIERIKSLTSMLAEKMLQMYPDLLSNDLKEQITLFSPLHDVGKIGISDTVLKKTDILTPSEFDIIKSHTIEGASLLRKTESFLAGEKNVDNQLSVAIEIAECHHEKYDGSGYPSGLAGENIPISARIVAVADVYDAIRSVRPYKKSYTHKDAVKIILSGDEKTSPEHFDPKVLEVFKAVNADFENLYCFERANEY